MLLMLGFVRFDRYEAGNCYSDLKNMCSKIDVLSWPLCKMAANAKSIE